MADQPEVNVTTPSGGSSQVPASVVNGPGDAPSYEGTGSGSNPTDGTVTAQKLTPKLAARTYPSVIAHLATKSYRETAKDASQVANIHSLLDIMKSLQDGTFEKKFNGGKLDTAMVNNLIDKVPSNQAQVQLSGLYDIGLSKSSISALQKVAASQTQIAYAAVGVNTSATNYTALANAGGGKLTELTQQETESRGNTAPLDPLTRTNGLLDLLDDIETGKSTANVNPSVWQGMLNRAGVPGGGQGNGYALATGNTNSDLNPGSQLSPQTTKAVERVTVQAIQTHMLDLGADRSEVESATTAKALRAVPLSSHLHSMGATDGYNLENVNTFGSFFKQVQQQSLKTKNGPGIPGAVVPGKPATAATPGTGTQLLDNFKYQWQNNAATRDEMASALTSAGVSSTAIGNKTSDYAQAANVFIKVMGQTPAGQNPWTYLQAQPQISAADLHTNPGYALVSAEATKIGVKLTNDQTNRLAQIYSGSTSTGNTDALDQSIAGIYKYDPNEDTQPGSFAATALQNIQQTFGSYGIELTNAQAGSYVQELLNKGGADLTSIYSAGDAAQAYAEDQAKSASSSLFPTLAPLINSGQTLTGSGGMLTPYLSQYAQMLGKDPDTVTLTPQLIKLMAAGNTGTSASVGEGSVGGGGALQSNAGGTEKGATTATGGLKSLDQFQAAVMQDPTTGWDKSPAAAEAYTNMSNSLLSTMGFAPPQGAQTPGSPSTSNLAGGQL
jgi:hypothetical protein